MNGLKNKFLLLTCISIFFICCAPAIIKPTIEDVNFAKQKWNDVSLAQLNNGYSLYVAKCGGCHFLHKINELNENRWLEILPIMSKKAKLTDEQNDLVMKYIITKCKSANSSAKK